MCDIPRRNFQRLEKLNERLISMKKTSKKYSNHVILFVFLASLAACVPPSTSSQGEMPPTLTELPEEIISTDTKEVVTETAASTDTATNTSTPSLPSLTPTPDYPIYAIQSAVSGMLITAASGAGVPGSEIVQLPASGGAEQQWRFVPVSGTEYFLIQSISGEVCLDSAGGRSYGEGWVLLQNPCNSSDSQQWMTIACSDGKPGCQVAPGSVWLKVKAGARVMDLPGDSLVSGEPINSNNMLHGGANQQWMLILIEP
jgi:hypothetical protein